MDGPATVQIDGRTVGAGHPTYVIAELGLNHGGSVETGKRLVEAAARAGADAVKLQTYRTEERVPADSPIFDILKGAELDEAGHRELQRAAADNGVAFASTPFSPGSADLLDALGVAAFKIASFDIVNEQLIDHVAAKGRPMIVSRGMAGVEESDRAVELVDAHGAPLALLHCVSAYPLEPADANLAVMDTLRERYGRPTGYSDHTLGIDVPALAVARGAAAIEKHFTLDREAEGPDHALSADPEGLAALVRRIREIEAVMGSAEPRLLEAEQGTTPYRRPTRTT